jgi:hypothetical protein
MNIKQLVTQIEQHTPTGWELWAGGSINQYNLNKVVSDTIVMILPNYPLFWREDECKREMKIEFYVLKSVGLKQTESEQQQHLPYNGLETIVNIHAVAIDFVKALADDEYLRMIQVSDVEFFPAVQGVTVNSQAVAKFSIKCNMYFKETDIFNYSLNTNIQ